MRRKQQNKPNKTKSNFHMLTNHLFPFQEFSYMFCFIFLVMQSLDRSTSHPVAITGDDNRSVMVEQSAICPSTSNLTIDTSRIPFSINNRTCHSKTIHLTDVFIITCVPKIIEFPVRYLGCCHNKTMVNLTVSCDPVVKYHHHGRTGHY